MRLSEELYLKLTQETRSVQFPRMTTVLVLTSNSALVRQRCRFRGQPRQVCPSNEVHVQERRSRHPSLDLRARLWMADFRRYNQARGCSRLLHDQQLPVLCIRRTEWWKFDFVERFHFRYLVLREYRQRKATVGHTGP